MASLPDALDLDLAKKLYENMKGLVDSEVSNRKSLNEKVSKVDWRPAGNVFVHQTSLPSCSFQEMLLPLLKQWRFFTKRNLVNSSTL